MSVLEDNIFVAESAYRLQEYGYGVVLLKADSKGLLFKNPHAFTRVEIEYWSKRVRFNIGILLTGSGLIVIDCDTPEEVQWAKERGLTSPMICQTSHGIHIYMKSLLDDPSNKIGKPADFLVRGHSTVPPSTINGFRRSWKNGIVRPENLPFFPSSLYPKEPLPKPKDHFVEVNGMIDERKVKRARVYLKTIPCVEHRGAHNACYRAVCKCRDFGLTRQEAELVMHEWNLTNPKDENGNLYPWSAEELKHKLDSIYGR